MNLTTGLTKDHKHFYLDETRNNAKQLGKEVPNLNSDSYLIKTLVKQWGILFSLYKKK